MISSRNPENLLVWSLDNHYRMLELPFLFKPGMGRLTAKYKEALLQETGPNPFELIPGQTEPDLEGRDLQMQVGSGATPCPLCEQQTSAGSVLLKYRGRQSGIVLLMPHTCPCQRWRFYCKSWYDTRCIPTQDRDCTWPALAHGVFRRTRLAAIPEETQKLIVAALMAFPFYSTFLAGRSGTGKSTLMSALFDRSLRSWSKALYERRKRGELVCCDAVWKATALDLAQQLQDWQFRDERPNIVVPTCLPSKVHSALRNLPEVVPHLSLDEFDKWKVSEFKSDKFHDLANEVYANGGQLVAASNLSLERMVAKMGAEQYGEPMIRRLIDAPRGMLIDLYTNRLYVNRIRHVIKEAKGGYALVPAKEVFSLANLPTTGLTAPAQQPIAWNLVMAPFQKQANASVASPVKTSKPVQASEPIEATGQGELEATPISRPAKQLVSSSKWSPDDGRHEGRSRLKRSSPMRPRKAQRQDLPT